MRVFLLAFVATTTIFASNVALANTAIDQSSTTFVSIPQVAETGNRFLRSYGVNELDVKDENKEEERGTIFANINGVIDQKKLDMLTNPKTIKAALGNANKEAALFATWHENPTIATVIANRLWMNGNFAKNKDVLLKFNVYRTRLKNLKSLVDTKALDDALEVLETQGRRGNNDMFAGWMKQKLKKEELVAIVKSYPEQGKKYGPVLFNYDLFLEHQASLAKRAQNAKIRAYMTS